MQLKKTFATEVAINTAGDLFIKQEDNDATYGESVIVLSREQARQVAQEIMRLDADDALWTVDE